ncbi:hypothetical protein QBC38DRAFT_497427 [Podospora fimiseda]|uniref:Uncharacterized protein n=1 Tax=Podospora fimiseda TaxID=252190 RepID=A0AAN7BU49_9PEZI|nr:hypothetical protein QBC38DRAFT_497427 [Podospora fimiseda]
MAANNNNPSQDGMTAEDIERVRQAMMLELGIDRLNELSIDDRPARGDGRRRDDRGNGRRRDDADFGRRPHPEDRDRNRGNNLIMAGGDLGSVWQAAIASGIFEDDDAAGVRGLDDLGGARSYARGSGQPASTQLTIQSVPIQNSFDSSQHAEASSSRNGQRPGAPQTSRTVISNFQRILTSLDRTNVTRAINNNAPIPIKKNSDKEPRRPSRVVAAPAAMAPQQHLAAPVAMDSSADAANDTFATPENTLVQVNVRFQPAQSSPMPARLYLSSGGPPSYGFFTVAVYGTKFCQWPMTTFDDCLNGEDLELVCIFNHGLGYSFVFRSQGDLAQVYKTLRAIKDKISAARKSGATLDAQSSQPVKVERSSEMKPNASSKECDQSLAAAHSLPQFKDSSSMPKTTGAKPGKASVPAADLVTSNAEGREVEQLLNSTVPVPQATELISLEADETSNTPSCAHSEASELLSTLEPYDFTRQRVVSQDPSEKFAQTVRAMARNFLCVIYATGAAGNTKTGIIESMGAIHQGIIQRFGDDDTLTPEQREAVEPALSSIFEEYYNNPPPPPAPAGSVIAEGSRQVKPPVISRTTTSSEKSSQGSRKTLYTADELIALRPNAATDVDIPWEDLESMPKPSERQAVKPRPQSARQTTPAPGWEPARLVAPTIGMDWVIGIEHKTDDKVVPEESTTVSAENDVQPTNVNTSQANFAPQGVTPPPQDEQLNHQTRRDRQITNASKSDVGLHKSRWATPTLAIQQAKAFTGPKYEKRWKQGSYLYDLAQLDPNIELNVGAEVIMDFFYPTSNQESSFQRVLAPSRSHQDPGPVARDRASVSSIDHVEHLRRGIERMTIRSQSSAASSRWVSDETPALADPQVEQAGEPSTVSNTSQSLPAGPNGRSLRGLGASRHASGAGPSTSRNFDFVLPKTHHK